MLKDIEIETVRLLYVFDFFWQSNNLVMSTGHKIHRLVIFHGYRCEKKY